MVDDTKVVIAIISFFAVVAVTLIISFSDYSRAKLYLDAGCAKNESGWICPEREPVQVEAAS